MLQIYTGFYYNDLRDLQKYDLKQDPQYGYYLQIATYKNDNLTIVPLWKLPNAIDIAKKYPCKDSKSEYLLDRQIFMEDQTYNRRNYLLWWIR
jgi:hypothetical protein